MNIKGFMYWVLFTAMPCLICSAQETIEISHSSRKSLNLGLQEDTRENTINLVISLYKQQGNDLAEEREEIVRRKLDVTTSLIEIQHYWDIYKVILLRPLSHPRLVLGCGNFPFDYNDDYSQSHAHINYDTVNPDLMANPTVIMCFPEPRLYFNKTFEQNFKFFIDQNIKYLEIFVEGYNLTNIGEPMPYLSYINQILKEDGKLIDNMISYFIRPSSSTSWEEKDRDMVSAPLSPAKFKKLETLARLENAVTTTPLERIKKNAIPNELTDFGKKVGIINPYLEIETNINTIKSFYKTYVVKLVQRLIFPKLNENLIQHGFEVINLEDPHLKPLEGVYRITGKTV